MQNVLNLVEAESPGCVRLGGKSREIRFSKREIREVMSLLSRRKTGKDPKYF